MTSLHTSGRVSLVGPQSCSLSLSLSLHLSLSVAVSVLHSTVTRYAHVREFCFDDAMHTEGALLMLRVPGSTMLTATLLASSTQAANRSTKQAAKAMGGGPLLSSKQGHRRRPPPCGRLATQGTRAR